MLSRRHVAIVHNIPKVIDGRPVHAEVVVPLLEALRRRGLVVSEHHEGRLNLYLSGGETLMTDAGKSVQADLVFGRTVGSARGYALLRSLALSGAAVMNDPLRAGIAGDKLAAAAALSAAGLPVVPTVSLQGGAASPLESVRMLGPGPLIVKPSSGFGGRGVLLASSPEDVSSLIGSSGVWIAQPYLRSEDIRVFCVGGEVVAAMIRTRPFGEHRANLHAGGTAAPVRLSDEERALAERASDVLGIDVAGVDLLRSETGVFVLEVNPNPGLQIAAVTGTDVVGAVAAHVASRAASCA